MTPKSFVVEHKVYTPSDHRLGRKVEHDSRSKRFAIKPTRAAIKTTFWSTQAPGLNQGDIGSCTGTSTAQLINTDYWTPARQRVTRRKYKYLDQSYAANRIYSLATKLDSYPGAYPPEDTGSSGLAAAKAIVQMGYASSYVHALSINALITGLQKSPCIVGTEWTAGMYSLDKNYYVKPTGKAEGGHEYLCLGVDIERDELWFRNSWGPDWGTEIPNICPDQAFRMTIANFTKLLLRQGDATFPVPVVS